MVFSDDFSTDPNSSGRWRIYRYAGDTNKEASWDPTNRTLYLTRASGWKAVAMFADYELTSTNWEAQFRYKAGGGSGADGFVFMFYKDEASYGEPGPGGFLGFQFWFGSGIAGYGIEFDNHPNPPSDQISDPSPNHIALVQDRVGSHLVYADDSRTEDNAWHDALIQFDNGYVVVRIDGDRVLERTVADPDYMYSGVGFSSATATYNNNHIIDDFVLRVGPVAFPDDPLFFQQWGLQRINITDAWSYSRGTSDTVVAVIDSGVDYTHIDLGSGKTLVSKGKNYYRDDSDDPKDDSGHGTHVAGIAAANTDNGQGIAGVCPNCRILPLKTSADAVPAAIRYATEQGARVINMSIAVGCTPDLARAVNNAYENNVVLVAASGNSCPVDVALGSASFEVLYPARFERVIAVGASDRSDGRAFFSHYGPALDVVAPGVEILSTHLHGGYKSLAGTSQASSMVAGLAGLILSKNPSLTPADVQAIIEFTADSIGNSGWHEETGWGRIDAGHAMQITLDPIAPAPPVTCTVSSSSEPDIPQSKEENLVSLYTRLRDEVLIASRPGQGYVNLYYEHGPELASILLIDSGLRDRTAQFLDNASEEFESLLPDSTAEVTLTQELYDEASALVQDLAAAGSESFQEEMLRVWSDMALGQYIGEKTTDIWEDMQHSVYLPIILKR